MAANIRLRDAITAGADAHAAPGLKAAVAGRIGDRMADDPEFERWADSQLGRSWAEAELSTTGGLVARAISYTDDLAQARNVYGGGYDGQDRRDAELTDMRHTLEKIGADGGTVGDVLRAHALMQAAVDAGSPPLTTIRSLGSRRLSELDDAEMQAMAPEWRGGTVQLARATAAGLVGIWAASASNEHSEALAMQRIVAEAHGLGTKGLDDYMATMLVDSKGGRRAYGHQLLADSRADYDALASPGRAFVRAEYAETQERLAAAGITTLSLVRGVSAETLGGRQLAKGAVVTMAANPATSWTTEASIAHGFAAGGGAVIVVTVPASRVQSTPLSGRGCAGEYEALLIGVDGADAGVYSAPEPPRPTWSQKAGGG